MFHYFLFCLNTKAASFLPQDRFTILPWDWLIIFSPVYIYLFIFTFFSIFVLRQTAPPFLPQDWKYIITAEELFHHLCFKTYYFTTLALKLRLPHHFYLETISLVSPLPFTLRLRLHQHFFFIMFPRPQPCSSVPQEPSDPQVTNLHRKLRHRVKQYTCFLLLWTIILYWNTSVSHLQNISKALLEVA